MIPVIIYKTRCLYLLMSNQSVDSSSVAVVQRENPIHPFDYANPKLDAHIWQRRHQARASSSPRFASYRTRDARALWRETDTIAPHSAGRHFFAYQRQSERKRDRDWTGFREEHTHTHNMTKLTTPSHSTQNIVFCSHSPVHALLMR